VVYNGIPMDRYPLREDKDDYVFFLGRADEEKAPHLAIEAARRAGRRLVMCATTKNERERRYWAEHVEPILATTSRSTASAPRAEGRPARPGGALAFPIQWAEPFGLVMTEAMACGTPVVAWRNGSVPEVVADGETGFIVDSVEEMAAAFDRVGDLDPRRCGPGSGAVLGRGHGRRVRARLRARPGTASGRGPDVAPGAGARPAPGWGGPPVSCSWACARWRTAWRRWSRSRWWRRRSRRRRVGGPAEVLGEVGTLAAWPWSPRSPWVGRGGRRVVVVVSSRWWPRWCPTRAAGGRDLVPGLGDLVGGPVGDLLHRAPRSPGTLSTTRFTCGLSSSWLTLAVIWS
jgi:hypothetical protein